MKEKLDFKWAADLAKVRLTVDYLRGEHNLDRCYIKLYEETQNVIERLNNLVCDLNDKEISAP